MKMLFMAYVPRSIEAVDFYCRAFNTASKHCYKANDDDDFYGHAEIVINKQTVLALCDVLYCNADFNTDSKKLNNMQFWLNFPDEGIQCIKGECRNPFPVSPM